MPRRTTVTCDQCGADLSSEPSYRLKLKLEGVAVSLGGFRGGCRPSPLMWEGTPSVPLKNAWFCGGWCLREWSSNPDNMRQEG